MPEYLTTAQVLAEVDEYWKTEGNPAVALLMRAAWERNKIMPPSVLALLHIRKVVMFERLDRAADSSERKE